ncbi:AAA family ATPase, partial [Candidatus Gracilibacteria bacterium]|nr:AAA family ATPase [Candidatus Gracilibacteria bacterium]
MKFYNREKEINNLKEIQSLSSQSSKMTIIIGRRRVGKTRLIREVFQGVDCVYLFVSKKEEAILCEEFKENIQNSLKIKILGEFKRFIDLFEYILQISFDKNITLILDEFQNFIYINSSVFSEFQNIWDSYKEKSKLNLILSGSIYSLMKKIFEDEKEPLFGRADNKINLQPFNVNTIKKILKEFYPEYNNFDLLTFYILSGGIPKYIEIFVDRKAFTLEKQLDLILSENSLFLEEVENLLISEFGKEYRTYFSILELISCGKSSRSEIESILGKNIGGYIERLEKDYLILRQIKPIFSKERTKNIKYEIVDNFINFWFRFLYKYKSAIEIGNFNYIKDII